MIILVKTCFNGRSQFLIGDHAIQADYKGLISFRSLLNAVCAKQKVKFFLLYY